MGWFSSKSKSSKSPSPAESQATGCANGEDKLASEKTKGDNVSKDKDEADEEEAQEKEKKKYAKEMAVRSGALEENETETMVNTSLNAMLYHFSDDSVDLYKSENNSLDLIGRMYYDDYDSSDRVVAEKVASFTSLASLARSPTLGPQQTIDNTLSPKLTLNLIYLNSLFERQVSFDTLCDDHHSGITLKVKHPEFKFRRNNKTVLVGFSNDPESLKAVEWAFLELLIHGDTMVVFHVLDEKTYSKVDPALADMVLKKLTKLNTHKRRISLVYEIVIGNPQKFIKRAITEYKPAMMIVGTHQYGQLPLVPTESSANLLSMNHHKHAPTTPPAQVSKLSSSFFHHGHKSIFSKASISEYFLQYALVPVIVVKPFYEIRETLVNPIESENYFSDWLANIDISHTREKKKKHRFGVKSPALSRSSSHTNLNEITPQDSRGRTKEGMFQIDSRGSSRSSSRSRSVTKSKVSEEQDPGASSRHRLLKLLSH